jgi:hypothetical protein
VRGIEAAAHRAAASPWARAAARLGFASKALLYGVVAILALLVAANAGGRTTDARGAIGTLARMPWGAALVALLAAGLVGHASWFALEAVANPNRDARGAWGVVKRVAKAFGALAYLGLAWSAIQLATGDGSGGSGTAAARSWTARALDLPGGSALVFLGGAVAVGVGVRQVAAGWGKLRKPELRLGAMGPRLRRWAPRIGLAGLASQGLVFAISGGFFVQAALRHSAREVRGFDGALAWLARQPYGMALLAAAALGLLAYGAWAAIEARYKPLPGG